MTDIYAEFGVNNAVMTSQDIAEHEENMLKLDVSARDGDDSITLDQPEEQPEAGQEEPEGNDEPQADEPEDQPEGDEEDQPEDQPEGDEEIEPLADIPDELKAASDSLTEYADGFSALREQAIKNGLAAETIDQIEAEYEANEKLSEASYKALESAGYTRSFVDSYIRGQESIATQFVNKVVEYAGGTEKFNKIVGHMKSNDPESVESLYEAMERQDLKSIRTIINLGIQSHGKKFGKAPARTTTKAAPAAPAKRAEAAVKGYASRQEMVADMAKSEYRLDAAFRAKVEARVAASTF